MPIWEALVKCPQGVYVKRDFRWYEVLSRRMLDVVRELSPSGGVLLDRRVLLRRGAGVGGDVPGPGRGGSAIHLRAGGGAGDGGDRPDADAGQADLGHGQAVSGPWRSSIATPRRHCWPTVR